MTSTLITIGILEDHELVREGFISMLNGYSGFKVVLEASEGKQLLKGLKDFIPDILLLDIEMPGLNGIAAMQKIRLAYPKVKIIVISAHVEDMEVVEYVKMGASSVLPKHSKKSTLITAISQVNEQGTYFEKRYQQLIDKFIPQVKQKKEIKLSERDLIFLKLFLEGKSYEKIAEEMNVVEKTLIWYKYKIMAKTNSKTLKDLQNYYKEHSKG